ncbi:MAG: PEP/pyruvate-binding domain-containing protein [bacterium]
MKTQNKQIDTLLRDLKERTKELNCLYRVEELLNRTDVSIERLLQDVVAVLPSGWQYPEICQTKIVYNDRSYQSPDYTETPYLQSANIVVQDNDVGQIFVSYKSAVPLTNGEYFLKEETKLINTIADRIGHTILYQDLKNVFNEWDGIREDLLKERTGKWRAIVDTLRRSDKKLFIYISRKMLNFLCWKGVEEAKVLLDKFGTIKKIRSEESDDEVNRPSQKQTWEHILNMSNEIFQVASENLNEDQVVSCIQKWIKEDKSRFLVRAIANPNSVLSDVINAITRYRYIEAEEAILSPYVGKGLRVSLIRRFFSDDLKFINVAKNYIDINDYYDVTQRIIYPTGSRGKLGGKSAGLFLAAQILRKCDSSSELLNDLRVPETWYITSDGLTSFLHYNNLDDVIEQKYKEADEIRAEYPNIIQIFKNSYFPPDIIKGLSMALDHFGNRPIIVRSSSLLEDRFGAVFSGKYKSLFLANQGSKEDQLEALMDAVSEVYASTFGPDPIEYRAERGLLDFHEEMGILIQEVVGSRIGNYFIPIFAGVAFSNNEFRWSARINREDGLVRIVPGLGTRAVDRLSDDYPILIAPGKPELRVNVTPDEICRYSPKKIDVINLESNRFETMEISTLLEQFGNDIPQIHHILSKCEDDLILKPSSSLNLNFQEDQLVVTFDGMIARTPLIKQLRAVLTILQENLGTPIDIEFAHDGKNLFLLQCRPQSYSKESLPASIPKNIPKEDIVFTAGRYVPNGLISDITHVVYVDPGAYSRIPDLSDLSKIGSIIGKINKVLPRRRFILMGPGRWGSRGDIRLGVNVTYADISNTAMLIEIARKKGNYVPELSFGTHFFQDLVESSIRYLPLYPDEENIVFNESFLLESKNLLPELLPEYASASDTVHVIDVPRETGGSILRILMNADVVKAVGFFAPPTEKLSVSSQ